VYLGEVFLTDYAYLISYVTVDEQVICGVAMKGL
jgi:hypothetical protein